MIIHRYLFREVSYSVAGVLALLMLVYSSGRFVRFLTEAAIGRTSRDLLFEMLLLKLADNLSLIVPIALFLGMMFALGRLHRDSEVVAMTAGGVGSRRLALGMLALSVGAACVAAVLSLYVSPTVTARYDVVRDRARQGYTVAGILPGRFKAFDNGTKVIYVGGINEDEEILEDVFVQVRTDKGQELLVSARAYQMFVGRDADRFVVLEDGYRYSGAPGRADYVVTRFEKHAVRLELSSSERRFLGRDALPTRALWGTDDPAMTGELQWRISLPLSVVILGAMAVPLSRSTPRSGRFTKLFVAVLIYFLYNNGVGIARKLVERGDLDPLVGVWPVHLAMALLALVLLFAQSTPGFRLQARWRRRRQAT